MERLSADKEGECVICQVNPVSSGIFPCGHISFCAFCVSKVRNNCPLCKSAIRGTFKFYK